MMKVGVIRSLSNSTPLIKVSLSAIQSLCSTLSNGRYTNAIPQPFSQHQYQDAFLQYTQGYNGKRSNALELMLNIMLECSRAYAQLFILYFLWLPMFSRAYAQHIESHNHVLQGLCLTLLPFSCWGHLCAPEVTLNTQSHNLCVYGFIHKICYNINGNVHLKINSIQMYKYIKRQTEGQA